jgi:hypothetical protein
MAQGMTPTPRDYSATDGEIPVLRWSNRRRMAWQAFFILVSFTLFYWLGLPLWFKFWGLDTSWLTIISESYSWFASTMAAVIIAYMGFNELPNPFRKGPPRVNRPQSPSSDEEYYEVDTSGRN